MRKRVPQTASGAKRAPRSTPTLTGGGGAQRGEWLYGRQPVREVLRAGKRHVHEALVTQAAYDSADLQEVVTQLHTKNIPLRITQRQQLDELCTQGNHQGVALRVGGFPYSSLEQLIQAVKEHPSALVLFLDHLEDPQNLGSLLRSADATGVTGVVLPQDRATGVTAAAVRAAAGASEHLCVVRVVNLVRAMQELKAEGLWLTGLEKREDARPCTAIDLSGPVGLVVGSEGKGLSRLVRENCDFLAFLPMQGRVNSLNASVAGAIALYEVLRQRSLTQG